MIIDPKNPKEYERGKNHFDNIIKNGWKYELKKVLNTRTSLQNSSLHMYWSFIANELNEMGIEFEYSGLITKGLSSRYTTTIVKEFIWRPIQIAMFDIKSTTKINTSQINEIIDVITKYFGDRGVVVDFPSIETLMNKNK